MLDLSYSNANLTANVNTNQPCHTLVTPSIPTARFVLPSDSCHTLQRTLSHHRHLSLSPASKVCPSFEVWNIPKVCDHPTHCAFHRQHTPRQSMIKLATPYRSACHMNRAIVPCSNNPGFLPDVLQAPTFKHQMVLITRAAINMADGIESR